jgi:RimJ/RimL family protein N-acetyltransferase
MHAQMVPFTTDRLAVRIMTSADAPVLAAYRNLAGIAEMQNWELPYTEELALEVLADHDGAIELIDPGWTQLAIERDGEIVGDLAVHLLPGGDVAEIGYTLVPSVHGLGYASEAAGEMVRRLFESGRHRVIAELSPLNVPSMRVLEAVGLVHEATTRESFRRRDGTWEDDLHYAVTADDYRAWRDRSTAPPADVQLVELSHVNVARFRSLETHYSQRRLVSPMSNSFQDALFPEWIDGAPVVPWMRGVEADGEPVGFVMLADVTEHHPDPFLWRLLIDRRHQRRGIGAGVIDLVIRRCQAMGCACLLTSYVADVPGSPEPFYRSLGFQPTGEMDGIETVAALTLASSASGGPSA